MSPGSPNPTGKSQAAAAAEAHEDRELMARVQAGDDAALGVLMKRWELPVKSLIARMVLNAGEAEELAQETFVRVWQQRARFRADAAFRPWVFAIAVNLARNRLRWWRRRPMVRGRRRREPASGRQACARRRRAHRRAG